VARDNAGREGSLANVRCFLLPGAAERDPGFRAEIDRLSVRSLYIIAGVNLGMPVMAILFHVLAAQLEPREMPQVWWALPAMFGLSALLVGVARTPLCARNARVIALAAGVLTAIILTCAELASNPDQSLVGIASFVNVVVVLLVGVSAVPAQPWHILVFGALINGTHWAIMHYAASQGIADPISLHYYAGMDLIMLLCVALTAMNYYRLVESYQSHQGELDAQSKLLVSDNAVAVGRFAATLSHELNNQLAVVNSSLDSLKKVSEKRAAGKSGLETIEHDLQVTASGSTARLQEIVERLQRFTNMEKAETATVDMEQLLRDVAAMTEPDADGVKIRVSCEALPTVNIRPQQISAVFSKLIHSSVETPDASAVEIVAKRRNGTVEIAIRSDGQGFPANERAALFEPGFKVRAGQVRGGNWGLFTARQAVREHGGELALAPLPGSGSEFLVSLPINN